MSLRYHISSRSSLTDADADQVADTESDRGRAYSVTIMEKAAKINGKKRMPFCRIGRSGQQEADQRQDAPAEKCDQGVQGPEVQQADDDEKSIRFEAKE
jgi:hypothetical protein